MPAALFAATVHGCPAITDLQMDALQLPTCKLFFDTSLQWRADAPPGSC